MSWRNALIAAKKADSDGYSAFADFILTWLPLVTDESKETPLFPEHATYEKELGRQLWGPALDRPPSLAKFLQARVEHLLKFVCPDPPGSAARVFQYFRCAFRWVIAYSTDVLQAPEQPETLEQLDAFRQLVLVKILEPAARAKLRKKLEGQLVSRPTAMAAWTPLMAEAAGKDMAALVRLFPPTRAATDDNPYLFQTFQLPAIAVSRMLDAVIERRKPLYCVMGEREDEVTIDVKLYPGMIVDTHGRVYLMNDTGTAYVDLNDRRAVIPFLCSQPPCPDVAEGDNPKLYMASVVNRHILDHAYALYVQGMDTRSDDMSALGSLEEDLRSRMEEDDREEDEGAAESEAKESAAPMEVEPRAPAATMEVEPVARAVGKRVAEREVIVIPSDDDETASQTSSTETQSARRSPSPATVPVPIAAVPGAVPVPGAAVPAPAKKTAAKKKAKKIDYAKDYEIVTADAWVPKARALRPVPDSRWRARWDEMQRSELWRDVDYALHFNVPGDTLFPRLLEYESDRFPYGRDAGQVARLTERIVTWLERLLPNYPAWEDQTTHERRTVGECIAVFEAMMDWVLLVEHDFLAERELVEAIARDAMRRRVLREMNPELLSNLRRLPGQPWKGPHISAKDFRARYQALKATIPWDRSLPEIATVLPDLQVDDTGQIDLFEQMSLRMSIVERILRTKGDLTEPPILLAFSRDALNSASDTVSKDVYKLNSGKDIVDFHNYVYPEGILQVMPTTGERTVQSYVLLPDLMSENGRRVPGRTSFFRSVAADERAIVFFYDRAGVKPGRHLFIAADKNRVVLDTYMFEKGPNQDQEREPMPDPEHEWQRARLVKIAPVVPEKKERGRRVKEKLDPAAEEAAEQEVERKYRDVGFDRDDTRLFDFPSDTEGEEEEEKASEHGAAASAPLPVAVSAPPPAAPVAVHVAAVRKKPKPPQESAEEAHRKRIDRELGLE